MIPASPEVQAETARRAALADVPESELATEATMAAASLYSLAEDRDRSGLVKLADGWHYYVPAPTVGQVLIVEDPVPIGGLLSEFHPVRIVREGPA